MHWEFTPIVVFGLIAFGLYQAARDVKSTHDQPLSKPDLIQDNINAGAAEVVVEGVTEKVFPTAVHAIVHAAEVVSHHVHF